MFETNALTQRERLIAAIFVVVTQFAQIYLLGRATAMLSLAMLISYFFWLSARWINDAETVLPYYLLAVAVQCLHFAEEFFTGFAHEFPRLFGIVWSETEFLVFNMAWLLIFALAVVGVKRGMPLAYLVVLFLAIGGGIGNGLGHLLLCAMRGRYFPGAVTAPFCVIMGIVLLVSVFRNGQGKK